MEPPDVGLAGETAEMKTSFDTFKATLGIIVTICTRNPKSM